MQFILYNTGSVHNARSRSHSRTFLLLWSLPVHVSPLDRLLFIFDSCHPAISLRHFNWHCNAKRFPGDSYLRRCQSSTRWLPECATFAKEVTWAWRKGHLRPTRIPVSSSKCVREKVRSDAHCVSWENNPFSFLIVSLIAGWCSDDYFSLLLGWANWDRRGKMGFADVPMKMHTIWNYQRRNFFNCYLQCVSRFWLYSFICSMFNQLLVTIPTNHACSCTKTTCSIASSNWILTRNILACEDVLLKSCVYCSYPTVVRWVLYPPPLFF